MAFTYSDALSVDRDKVRLEVNDVVENEGPRPDGRNFSDAEIAYFLTDEGSVNGAIARVYENLAGAWTSYALSEREGDVSMDAKETASEFRKRADEWRAKAGGGSNTIFAGAITLDYQQTDSSTDIYN